MEETLSSKQCNSTPRFSLKSNLSTSPSLGKVSKKQDRWIYPKQKLLVCRRFWNMLWNKPKGNRSFRAWSEIQIKAYLTGLLVVISKKKSSLTFTARIILLILLKEISFRFIKKFLWKRKLFFFLLSRKNQQSKILVSAIPNSLNEIFC